MPIPPKVVDLIERFDEHRDAYRSPEYNEAQVRDEFIDPMFEALGWDIHNRLGFAEQFKQVVHEDSVRIGGVAKAPDYSFRLGGRRMFFLEAKKPSVNLKEDPSPAYQLRRYAWTAKLPVSILSDFEEFIVYDTRVKPVLGDKASTARVLYIPYAEYPERWEEMAAIFSPQAIQKGALDKYVESTTKRRGTAEVDDAFLAEIEEWRDLLARNIALRNSGISQRELNYAVQTTIDRIVFLRICEDRAIEPYAQLMALQNGGDVYARLRVLYERADERYNSGLFHFHKEKDRPGAPDTLTPGLDIDDKVLKAIIKRLYYPESPYEFSVLPAEILGQVYERFLGSVIRLTAGGQAKVEQKPEVRKAGGVYYTPSYIVDYIVKHTVGKLLEGKTPQDVAGVTESWRPSKIGRPLAILDPACGSGSFLLGAYQYLLDWHLEYYSKDIAKSSTGKEPRIYQDHRGVWRLATSERKRILLANIYGVDIDSQAVEVTKLSLLLRVLEGESAETLSKQFALFHERALPDLANNIKCGNSLIGPDFYQGKQLDAFDEEETYRINAFDWNAEFPDIIKSGGFDGVIGNPPYIRMEAFKDLKSYLKLHYEVHADRADIFFYFIERGTRLLRCNGVIGFIVSNTFTRSQSGRNLRQFTKSNLDLESLTEFGDITPFVGATVYPLVLVAARSTEKKPRVPFFLQELDMREIPGKEPFVQQFLLEQSTLDDQAWVFEPKPSKVLRERLLRGFQPLLNVYNTVGMGIKTGLNEAFIISDQVRDNILSTNPEAVEIIHPYLSGQSLDRWTFSWNGQWLIYTPHGIDVAKYPAILEHLSPWKAALKGRATNQNWYELQQPQAAYASRFTGGKIIFPDMSRYPKFSLDHEGMFFSNTVYFIASDSEYLLGLLNSKVSWFVIRGLSNALRGGLWRFRLFSGHIERLPLPTIRSNADRARHDKMVSLVQRMLDLHKRLQATNTEHERGVLQRQIAATDDEIDRLVYELYELTDEEIAIVEGSAPK